MWIVNVALKRPYTFIVMAILILLATPLALMRTPVDVLPEINIPVISVIWTYNGLSAQDIADRMISGNERGLTTTVNNIEHIESQSLPGIGIIKIFLQPTANIQTTIAQVVAVEQAQVKQMPPGATPPLVISYSASSIPVMQLGLSSPSLSEPALNDTALNFLRPQLVTIPGAAVPYPYGGKTRLISVDIDTRALLAKGLTAQDVVAAVNTQNLILPTGTAKIGPREYTVDMNGSPPTVEGLNNIPVRTVGGATTYLREVAHVRTGFSPQTNIVRQNGQRGVLMSIMKTGDASTLSVVDSLKALLPEARAALPPDLHISALFDQSVFVKAAVQGVIHEALIAAALTAAMILLFLGNWRSTCIIAISIPLSILSSLLALHALGQTINIMTLGGLALAVGILVDDATVTIENIERHLHMGTPLHEAILDGAGEIAVPALVSTLCICIVFVPMFFLTGVARYLFVPLAEAVVFAMLASYILSRTLVPTLAMLLMGHVHQADPNAKPGALRRIYLRFDAGFERMRAAYIVVLSMLLVRRRVFATGFLAFCVLSMGLVFALGADFFPTVDAGDESWIGAGYRQGDCRNARRHRLGPQQRRTQHIRFLSVHRPESRHTALRCRAVSEPRRRSGTVVFPGASDALAPLSTDNLLNGLGRENRQRFARIRRRDRHLCKTCTQLEILTLEILHSPHGVCRIGHSFGGRVVSPRYRVEQRQGTRQILFELLRPGRLAG